MLKNVTLLFLILTTPIFLKGQIFEIDEPSIVTCEGTFTDNGGILGNYFADENFITTICADGLSNSHIQLAFFGIDLGIGDELCFYDGENTAATALTCFNADNNGQFLLVQATAENLSGCLTVTFNSDDSNQGAGWESEMACINPCQVIEPVLLSTEPAIMPVDTGWIAVCPNQEISFSAAGNYPQNNASYTQSDATSIFEWDFGDGNTGFGSIISHQYENAGGYFVQLTITDTVGCTNTNFLNIPIRVAAEPNFNIAGTFEAVVCAADTIEFSASVNEINGNSTLSVTANPTSFQTPFVHVNSSGLSLPDGSGASYQSSISITDFAPNMVLDNTNMLTNICVVIEHSWMRDLEIMLTCPNGQTILLHDHPGQTGGQVFLGEPIDNDGGFPTPGVGYEYCWTPNSANPTWIQYANANQPGTLPSQDYSTVDPISNLDGCPLNGLWTLTVTDLWASDNGFLFEWSLGFDGISGSTISFQNDLVDWEWQNVSNPIFQSMDSVATVFQNDGNQDIIFAVTDEIGCVWDTTLTVEVLPENHPDCSIPEITIAGLIANSDGAGKDEVPINLTGTTSDNFETFNDGLYEFSDLIFQGDYTARPEKDFDYFNGVTGFDLVKIQRHLLVIELLDSPYALIAADANNSNSVSVLDLVAIRRLILQIVDTFPNNTSYRFIDETYEFPNPINPWQETFPESITHENIEMSQLNTNFVAIKVGDVNNSANLLAVDDRYAGTVDFTVNDQFVKAGTPVRVEFTAKDYHHFGHQFTLHFPNLELINIEEGVVKTSDFGQSFIHQNMLTTCWTSPIALEMEEHETLFTLNFQAKSDGYLSEFLSVSSEITTNEAYSVDGNIQRVNLAFANEEDDFEFKLLQNVPNPFSEKTSIGFVLPKSGNSVLTIFDAKGRILKTIDKNYEKGQHQVDINYEELGAKGLLFYQLETEMGAKFRKMVVF